MIWLIGCKGMLGTEISRTLSENNIDFRGTDIDVDITNINALEKFASSLSNLEFIINCSAYTAVDKAESDAEFAEKLNADGPENIAKVAKKIGAKMIHISTDYVFDGSAKEPYTEESQISPIGVYGKTKADGENRIRQILNEFYIIRTAWLYGWAGKNFVYTMIKAMNSHDSIKVVGDQRGTPTFAGTLAGVILKIVQNKNVPYGIYHCTDKGEISWWDFACEIKKQGVLSSLVTNSSCAVNKCTTADYPTPAKRPEYSVLSKQKIQKTLGITLPDWKESLKVFLESPLFDKTRIQ